MRFRVGHIVLIVDDYINSRHGFSGVVDYVSEGTYILSVPGAGWHVLATDETLAPYWLEAEIFDA